MTPPSPGSTLQRPRRQRGAMAVIGAMMALVILGVLGMALDLSRIINRRLELDTVASAAALLAAKQLNGTPAGINAALAQAATVVNALRYDQHRNAFQWNDDVLSFSATRHGEWLGAAAARTAADRMLFVRADTALLTAPASTFGLVLIGALPGVPTAMAVTATAVAGRSGIEVAPLALCAMSSDAAASRANPGPPASVELVEYGFRRGVAYDLMQLNPHGVEPQNFLIDPFAPPGMAGAPANVSETAVGPYVCAGELALTTIGGAALTVQRPFPLSTHYKRLNARFNQYLNAQCTYATAPPDRNIRQFTRGANTAWMTATPSQQSALAFNEAARRWTVADPLPAPAGTLAVQYGPLWTYARPVPFSASGANGANGADTPFGLGDWASLYAPGTPAAVVLNYPAGTATPYFATSGVNFQGPPASMKGVAERRVLQVPLLACPVPAGSTSATVLGVGKFLLTVEATATSLVAEFGGLVPEAALRGPVELYR
ncbi:MAG: pilus assembly protein TadE [Duganella sp.]